MRRHRPVSSVPACVCCLSQPPWIIKWKGNLTDRVLKVPATLQSDLDHSLPIKLLESYSGYNLWNLPFAGDPGPWDLGWAPASGTAEESSWAAVGSISPSPTVMNSHKSIFSPLLGAHKSSLGTREKRQTFFFPSLGKRKSETKPLPLFSPTQHQQMLFPVTAATGEQ